MPFDRLAAAKIHLGAADLLRVDDRRYREFRALRGGLPCGRRAELKYNPLHSRYASRTRARAHLLRGPHCAE
jgi:DNA-binding transcriptional regulator LsrR (DeoR family)